MCRNESVENKILKPLNLGLFIGQGLGFKYAYLESRSCTCRGWIPYTCPGVSWGIVFWNVLRLVFIVSVVDRCVMSLSPGVSVCYLHSKCRFWTYTLCRGMGPSWPSGFIPGLGPLPGLAYNKPGWISFVRVMLLGMADLFSSVYSGSFLRLPQVGGTDPDWFIYYHLPPTLLCRSVWVSRMWRYDINQDWSGLEVEFWFLPPNPDWSGVGVECLLLCPPTRVDPGKGWNVCFFAPNPIWSILGLKYLLFVVWPELMCLILIRIIAEHLDSCRGWGSRTWFGSL